jgi:hypothetical protein
MGRRVVGDMRVRPVLLACVALLACACGTTSTTSGDATSATAGVTASASAGGTPSASASATASSTAATSGIDLRTMAGPTCPVQRQGDTCTAPVAATVVITHADGSSAAQVQTGADGTAHVPLAPGAYTLTGQPGHNGFPRPPAPQHAAVTDGSFVLVQMLFDTGIR